MRGAAEIKAEITEVEAELAELAELGKQGFPVVTPTAQAQKQLQDLQAELLKVGTAAQQASAVANAALATIAVAAILIAGGGLIAAKDMVWKKR